MKIIQVVADVKIPTVPNFLSQTGGGTIPIEAVTDEGLEKIGKAWTENLIAKAAERRALTPAKGE